MNINNFLLSLFNSAIEITFYYIIVISLLEQSAFGTFMLSDTLMALRAGLSRLRSGQALGNSEEFPNKHKNLSPKLYKGIFCILLIILNIMINIPVKNEIAYTAISVFFIFLITLIISGETVMHSLYLFMISYSITLIIQLEGN